MGTAVYSRPEPETKVYLIKAGNEVKIGCSNDPHKRLGSLQTSNQNDLALLATLDSEVPAYELEGQLHQECKDFHLRGEWFSWEALIHVVDNYPLSDVLNYSNFLARISLRDMGMTQATKDKLGSTGSELYQYYLDGGFQYTDTQAATALGWKDTKVKRIRLSLMKAGWFKQVNLKNQTTGLTATITYLGQDACAKVETSEEFTERKQMEAKKAQWLKDKGYGSMDEFKSKASHKLVQELNEYLK